MKKKNSIRKWFFIEILIAIIILILLAILNSKPLVDFSKLDTISKLSYDWGTYKEEKIPIWKIIGYCVVGILTIVDITINIVFIRCKNCKRHIRHMDITQLYCPYCSKELE